jgi:hypothetical protein
MGLEVSLLGNISNPKMLSSGHSPLIRVLKPGQNPKKRTFPRPIRPDYPDPVFFRNPQCEFLKKTLGPIGFGQFLAINQR